ncbi:unnamed protein product [Brassica napus]|uniref:(rape) hypothetical protein n=1 Tax=Brassica napus TaxID=3708 RepID=A0A816MGD5_BRANA|nr:unnamed protein product [Brassica napus]
MESSGYGRSRKDRAEMSRDVVECSMIRTSMNVEIKWRAWIPDIWIDVNTGELSKEISAMANEGHKSDGNLNPHFKVIEGYVTIKQ